MIWQRWQNTPVVQRIRILRWVMPLIIVAVVVVYQLGLASYVHNVFNPTAHILVEIAFYSVAGPVVTWLTLKRIGQWLGEKDEAEKQLLYYNTLQMIIICVNRPRGSSKSR